MEMGTMEKALLQDHGDGPEGAFRTGVGLSTIGAWSISTIPPLFTWRSGEDVSDGGHMIVPSIGHPMPSPTSATASPATARPGMAHIVPITWHRIKNKSSDRLCVRTLLFIATSVSLNRAGTSSIGTNRLPQFRHSAARAVQAAVLCADAAGLFQAVLQRLARPMQAHGEIVQRDAEILRNRRRLLSLEIDALEQLGVRRP